MELAYEQKYLQLEKNNWWFVGRRQLIKKICKRIVNKDSKVLDIGCGSGRNMGLFNSGNVYGLDISSISIRKGRDSGNKNLLVGDALKLPFKNNVFDCIFCLDLLEHIENDKKVLEEASKILKDDGLFISFVPCFNFLWGDHDIVNNHFRRYSKKDFKRLIKDLNFSIEKNYWWNFLLLFPIFLYRSIKKVVKKKEIRIDDHINLPLILNSFLLAVLKIENYLVSKNIGLPFGVSLVTILRRTNHGK
jgi:ubiquinone/menaquinone biosynthesis C-methylase UbiE